MASSAAPAPNRGEEIVRGATDGSIMKRNLAIGLVIACPLIMLTPPRRINAYTLLLAGTTLVSANHLVKDRTGRSLVNRLGFFSDSVGLPTEKALRYKAMIAEKKQAEAEGREWKPKPLEEYSKDQEKEKGVLEKVWLGKEGGDWKEKRLQREREVLQQGDGVSTLIAEYFAEAFGRNKDGSKKDEGEEEEGKR